MREWDNSPDALAARERIVAAKARGAAEGRFGKKIAEEEAQDRFRRWIEHNFPGGASPTAEQSYRRGLLTMHYLTEHARDDRVRFLAANKLMPQAPEPPKGPSEDEEARSVSDEFDRRMAEAEESGAG